MQLHCPRCGNAIPGDAIDLAKGIGVCRPCGEIVPVPTASQLVAPTPVVIDSSRYLPDGYGFIEREEGDVYEVRLSPRRWTGIPILGFSLFWNAFVTFWIWGAAHASVLFAMFGIPFALVGLGLMYGALVTLFNSRRVTFAGGRLVVRNGPIPARGSFVVELAQVDGFTSLVRSRETRNGVSVSIDYVVNLSNGTSKSFSSETDDTHAASYGVDRFNEALARSRTPGNALPYRS